MRSVVLARMLGVDDFAIVGVALAIGQAATIAQDLGASQAIIQAKSISKAALDSFFILLSFGGLSIAILLALSAPAISRFYATTQLELCLQIVAASYFVNMATSVPFALLTRNLKFKQQAILGTCKQGLAAFVAVIMAYHGAGFLSLILPDLVLSIVFFPITCHVADWRPECRFQWSAVRPMMGYSSLSFIRQSVGALSGAVPGLILGTTLSAHDYGIFFFATTRSRKILNSLVAAVRSAAFPVFSAFQNDTEALKIALYEAARLVHTLVYPVAGCLITLSPELVPAVFGEQWRDASDAFAVFCLLGFWMATTGLSTAFLRSQGTLWPLILSVGTSAAVMGVALPVASSSGDVWIVAATIVAIDLLQSAYWIRLAQEKLGALPADLLKTLIPAVPVTLIALAVDLVVERFATNQIDPHLAVLARCMVFATISMTLLLRFDKNLRAIVLRASRSVLQPKT